MKVNILNIRNTNIYNVGKRTILHDKIIYNR